MSKSAIVVTGSRVYSSFMRLMARNKPMVSGDMASSVLPSSTRSCVRRSITRLPVELSCFGSLPLHSAIASARLQSILSAEFHNQGLLPQATPSINTVFPSAIPPSFSAIPPSLPL
ncbi:hypothetical protein AMTRI_Chr05g57060 [Amborella trichopoda]